MKNLSDTYYLDSNFLIAYFVRNHDDHNSSRKLMFKLFEKNKKLFISCLSLDETLYKVKETLEIQIPKNRRKPFKDFYGEFMLIVDSILNNPHIKIVQFEKDLNQGVKNVIENIKNYNLGPRDAFHLALMQDLEIGDIVTKNKKDFEKIPGIKICSF